MCQQRRFARSSENVLPFMDLANCISDRHRYSPMVPQFPYPVGTTSEKDVERFQAK